MLSRLFPNTKIVLCFFREPQESKEKQKPCPFKCSQPAGSRVSFDRLSSLPNGKRGSRDRNKGQQLVWADTCEPAHHVRSPYSRPLRSPLRLHGGASAQAACDPGEGASLQIPCFYTDLGECEGWRQERTDTIILQQPRREDDRTER